MRIQKCFFRLHYFASTEFFFLMFWAELFLPALLLKLGNICINISLICGAVHPSVLLLHDPRIPTL